MSSTNRPHNLLHVFTNDLSYHGALASIIFHLLLNTVNPMRNNCSLFAGMYEDSSSSCMHGLHVGGNLQNPNGAVVLGALSSVDRTGGQCT